QIGMIMICHAHYPSLGDDKPTPASLSSRVIGGLLRKKLGYKGIAITDDLTMGAVTSLGLTTDIFLRALEAGNDLLLFSQTTPLVERAFHAIVKASRSSAALRGRVEEAVGRIRTLIKRLDIVQYRHLKHMNSIV